MQDLEREPESFAYARIDSSRRSSTLTATIFSPCGRTPGTASRCSASRRDRARTTSPRCSAARPCPCSRRASSRACAESSVRPESRRLRARPSTGKSSSPQEVRRHAERDGEQRRRSPATNAHCWRAVIRPLRHATARTARAARRSRRADPSRAKIALPATNVSAPARHTSSIVSRLMPPSTSSTARRCAPSSSMRRARAILSSERRNELLSAEPGIHRHDQQQIEVVEHLAHRRERRRRIERHAGRAAELADARELALQVRRRLRRGSSARSRPAAAKSSK